MADQGRIAFLKNAQATGLLHTAYDLPTLGIRVILVSEGDFEAAGERPVAGIVKAVEPCKRTADFRVISRVLGGREEIAADERDGGAARTERRDEVRAIAREQQ